MLQVLPDVLKVLLLAASACTALAGGPGEEAARLLVYPDQGGLHKLVVGLSVPVDMRRKFLSWAVNFQFQYQMPQNVSELTPATARGACLARPTRRHLYRVFEQRLDRNDVDGLACVLRTICQVAEKPLHHNGLLGELLHILFTPESCGSEEMDAYQTAEAAGRSSEDDCSRLYPGCPPGHGLMDLIAYDET